VGEATEDIEKKKGILAGKASFAIGGPGIGGEVLPCALLSAGARKFACWFRFGGYRWRIGRATLDNDGGDCSAED